jgi:hypothetical protein
MDLDFLKVAFRDSSIQILELEPVILNNISFLSEVLWSEVVAELSQRFQKLRRRSPKRFSVVVESSFLDISRNILW